MANKVFMVGRLTKDPEVTHNNDNAFARFSIAVERRYKRESEPTADFFNTVCFSKTAEFVEKYLHKGTKIVLSGRLENNNYTNKDGQKVYDIRIVAEEIEFAESKKVSEENGTNTEVKKDDSYMNVPVNSDEDLPFN